MFASPVCLLTQSRCLLAAPKGVLPCGFLLTLGTGFCRENYCRGRVFASPVCLLTQSRCLLPQRCFVGALNLSASLFPASLSARLFLLHFPVCLPSVLVCPSVLKIRWRSGAWACLPACLVSVLVWPTVPELVSQHSTNMSIQFLQTSWHCRATFLLDTDLACLPLVSTTVAKILGVRVGSSHLVSPVSQFVSQFVWTKFVLDTATFLKAMVKNLPTRVSLLQGSECKSSTFPNFQKIPRRRGFKAPRITGFHKNSQILRFKGFKVPAFRLLGSAAGQRTSLRARDWNVTEPLLQLRIFRFSEFHGSRVAGLQVPGLKGLNSRAPKIWELQSSRAQRFTTWSFRFSELHGSKGC